MYKKFSLGSVSISVFLLFVFASYSVFSQVPQNITITTYYPSPYGAYNDLTAHRMAIGNLDGDALDAVDVNDLPFDPAAPANPLVNSLVVGPDNAGDGGRIGIGTQSPTTELSIAGGGTISTGTTNGTDDTFLNLSGGGDMGAGRGSNIFLVGNEGANPGQLRFRAGYDAAMAADTEGAVLFRTGTGAVTDRMIIHRGGNIGININAPAERLHVVETNAGTAAIWGDSQGGGVGSHGVHGVSTDSIGVFGQSASNIGVFGSCSGSSNGVYGYSNGGEGVKGHADGVAGTGVYGEGFYGVRGVSTAGGGARRGVWAEGGQYGLFADGDTYGVYSNVAAGGTAALRGNGGSYGVMGNGSVASIYGMAGATWAGYFDGPVFTGNIAMAVLATLTTTNIVTAVLTAPIINFTVAPAPKPFFQPHPQDPEKQIKYVSLEGRDVRIFLDGVAELRKGEAIIEIPEDFKMVASSKKPLNVILTPFGEAHLYVKERSLEKIHVKSKNASSVEFGYLVIATRGGFEESQPIEENIDFRPGTNMGIEQFEAYYEKDTYERLDSQMAIDLCQDLLISNGILTKEGKVNKELMKKLGWESKKEPNLAKREELE